MKSNQGVCARCGKPLPTDAPRELCPPCLLEAVLSAPDDFMAEEERNDDTLDFPEVPTVPDFQVQQLLGTGGFGEVYSAEQIRPIRRMVAMKILKRGMNSRQVMRRFDAERQALALMDHPNIATVYDAGETADKRPFVTMELVKGPPVTTFCDREEWKIRERLELFITICDAVQHAHQKGVIHRDLKPSNILVARDESGEAAPRVIDFGIAKALDEPFTNQTVVTQLHQVMGTPAYMSPEQTDNLRAAEVDTRSDIYALGVILYELLTGTVPFPRSKDDSVLEHWLQRIREDEPDRPSQRLEKVAHGPRRAWIRETRGDLDWITLKALEKDPERRYESARALADDLRRHLDFEPVLACPPGNFYRIGKLIRRHRVTAIFTAVLVAVIVAGLAGTALMYFKAEGARQAEARALEELRSSYSRSDLTAADQMAARGQSSQAVAILSRALRTDPDNLIARAHLLNTLSRGSFFRESRKHLPIDSKIKRVEHLETDAEGTELIWAGKGENEDWFVQSGDRCWAPRPGVALGGLSLAPNGDWFAAGWEDGQIDVFGLTGVESEADLAAATTFQSSKEAVLWIQVLSDSERIALRSGGLIEIRSLSSSEEFVQLDPEGIVSATAVSDDGSVIAVGTRKGLVLAWDTVTGDEIFRLNWKHSVDEISLNFDGGLVALGSLEKVAQAWNLQRKRPLSPPVHHPLGVTKVLISPDESRLITGCADGSRRVWELRSNRLVVQDTPMDEAVTFINLSPTGQAVVGSRGGLIKIGQLTNLRTTALGFGGRTLNLTMNKRGTRLFGVNPSRSEIVSWHVRTGGVGSILLDTNARFPIRDLSLDPAGEQLLAPSDRNTIERISLSGEPTAESKLELDSNPIVMSQDYAITRNGTCWFLGDDSSEPWQLTDGSLRHAAIRPADGSVAGSTIEGLLFIGDFRTQTGKLIELPPETEVSGLAWSPIEPVLAIAVSPNELLFYDARTGDFGPRIQNRLPIQHIVFAPDGQMLIAASKNGNLRAWNLKSNSLAWSRPMPHAVGAIKISGDGKRVIASTTRGIIRLFDTETGLPESPPFQTGEIVSSLATDYRGEVVAIGCESGALRWFRLPDMPRKPEPIDPAFLEFAEQFSGWKMDEAGNLERIGPSLKEHVLTPEFAAWRDWLLGDPGDRTIFPGAEGSTQSHLQQLLDGESIQMRMESRRLRAWLR